MEANAVSRRGFMAAAAGAGLAMSAQPRTVAYIAASGERDKGIHRFDLNQSTGVLTSSKVVTKVDSPSCLFLHPNHKFLYAGNSVPDFAGKKGGAVTAMSIDGSTGDLTVLNTMSSGGNGPAHISVDPSGKWLFVANYNGGSLAVLPVLPDGKLGEVTHTEQISGPLGPQPAAEAPPGSYAMSGHDAPHVHMTMADPGGNFLLATDLGTDRVYVYALDKAKGTLKPAATPFLQTSPGAGPRHLSFHPSGKLVYFITEEASTVVTATFDPATGQLMSKGPSLSTLPAGFTGTNYPSGILVSPDGRFLYGANRLYDSLAIFPIDGSGLLGKPKHAWTHGSYPRQFAMDPSGEFLYICHTRSDNVTGFRVNRKTGMLTFLNQWVPLGNPSEVLFLRLGS